MIKYEPKTKKLYMQGKSKEYKNILKWYKIIQRPEMLSLYEEMKNHSTFLKNEIKPHQAHDSIIIKEELTEIYEPEIIKLTKALESARSCLEQNGISKEFMKKLEHEEKRSQIHVGLYQRSIVFFNVITKYHFKYTLEVSTSELKSKSKHKSDILLIIAENFILPEYNKKIENLST